LEEPPAFPTDPDILDVPLQHFYSPQLVLPTYVKPSIKSSDWKFVLSRLTRLKSDQSLMYDAITGMRSDCQVDQQEIKLLVNELTELKEESKSFQNERIHLLFLY
jgi:hypothetical protein